MAKKVHEVIFILESHGWVFIRQTGSHRQYRRSGSVAVITVAGKRSSTMTVGQLANIRRLTGIKELR
jgi:predicted RNA binding protein YcfA (HicA-like mRNA interferase family)